MGNLNKNSVVKAIAAMAGFINPKAVVGIIIIVLRDNYADRTAISGSYQVTPATHLISNSNSTGFN